MLGRRQKVESEARRRKAVRMEALVMSKLSSSAVHSNGSGEALPPLSCGSSDEVEFQGLVANEPSNLRALQRSNLGTVSPLSVEEGALKGLALRLIQSREASKQGEPTALRAPESRHST